MQASVLKDEARKTIERLQTMRDEVRLQLHLAGMEAKDQWKRLEPRIQQVADRVATDGSEGAKAALHEITEELRAFRASLEKH